MRVLVTGSREWTDVRMVYATLRGLQELALGEFAVAHGAARGADRLAARWCKGDPKVTEHAYPADWDRDGRAAGPIRNQRMLDEFEPELVVAFKDGLDPTLSRGGTEHMVKIAKAKGVPVVHVHHL